MKQRLKKLEQQLQKLYDAKSKAENDSNYKLSQQINSEIIPLAEEASELEFKIEFQ